ncbi:hypothetical protein AU190_20945 [Mycolicibacterium acapulense]|nr:hypothetical protein AU190_20945 [Mycolicibacterium acapulense]KUI12569.1 hypothetical protein AU191_20235 [Mycolicibacterium acapulense]
MRGIERYRSEFREEWDTFVRGSRNGTFLFERGYMDYHAHRFEDFSLIIRDKKGRVEAMLPANRDEDRIVSHGGLTYGGFIVGSSTRVASVLEIFEQVVVYLAASGIREFLYKPVPYIYHRQPCEEDLYALFRLGARLVQRDVGACACPSELKQFSERVRGPIRKAERAGVVVEESERFEDFWPILENNLATRYQSAPVHSLSEIKLLKSRFPSHIRLFLAKDSRSVLAGSVLYETANAAHIQYAGSTADGRAVGAQHLLLVDLLQSRFQNKKWFDYGISTEAGGRALNTGLQEFKEGFGLRAIVSDRYSISLSPREARS